MHPFTRCVHAGSEPEKTTGAIFPPIFQVSTFVQQAPGEHQGFDYSRARNPTRDALETALADLEGARHALAFSSGLAAEQAIIQIFSPSKVLVCDDVYGGTGRLFRTLYAKYGFEFHFMQPVLDELRQSLPSAVERHQRLAVAVDPPRAVRSKQLGRRDAGLPGLRRRWHGQRQMLPEPLAPQIHGPRHRIAALVAERRRYVRGNEETTAAPVDVHRGPAPPTSRSRVVGPRCTAQVVATAPSPSSSVLV